MCFRRGTTFWLKYPGSPCPHLCFLLTDPDANGLALMVNMTELDEMIEDRACVLLLADREHPAVTKDSVIAYAKAKAVPVDGLRKARAAGMLQSHRDASPTLVTKLIDGARRSPSLPQKLRLYLQ
jgi:hypothetical protein